MRRLGAVLMVAVSVLAAYGAFMGFVSLWEVFFDAL